MTFDLAITIICVTGLLSVAIVTFIYIWYFSWPAKLMRITDNKKLKECCFDFCDNKADKEIPVSFYRNDASEFLYVYKPVCDFHIKNTRWSAEVIGMERKISE